MEAAEAAAEVEEEGLGCKESKLKVVFSNRDA